MSLTVGQLRDLLNGVPDDVAVHVAHGSALATLSNVYRAGASRVAPSHNGLYVELVQPGNHNFMGGGPAFIIRLTP